MSDLSKFSDQELQTELERRAAEDRNKDVPQELLDRFNSMSDESYLMPEDVFFECKPTAGVGGWDDGVVEWAKCGYLVVAKWDYFRKETEGAANFYWGHQEIDNDLCHREGFTTEIYDEGVMFSDVPIEEVRKYFIDKGCEEKVGLMDEFISWDLHRGPGAEIW